MSINKKWFNDLVENCDYDLKLALVCWTIYKINEHGKNPGSFRNLIYNIMGFGPEAYIPIYEAGGMNITNELNYKSKNECRKIICEEKIENKKLKNFFSICDEPGCFNDASCGWMSKNGYRLTCFEHSDFIKKSNNF